MDLHMRAVTVLSLFLFPLYAFGQTLDDAVETRPPAEFSRTSLNEIIVQLQAGQSLQSFAQDHRLALSYQFRSDTQTAVLRPLDGSSVTPWLSSLTQDSRVAYLSQNYQTAYVQQSFTPNDPLFGNTGGYTQWHINPTGARPHINISAAGGWKSNTPGAGVIIGIVDAGIEPGHVDIAANFNSAHTFDFVTNSATQTMNNGDTHGMSVAGVAAARGGNSIGVTGVAPFAQVASMKVFGSVTASDAGFRDAVLYHSSGSDTSVKIKNHSYGIPTPFEDDSIHNGGLITSALAGTVHVMAAGNDRGSSGQDANKKMAQANPLVITVAALNHTGTFSNYSNFGANIFVTAPSNRTDGSAAPGTGISTTDRTGSLGYNSNGTNNYADLNFTNTFGGTSSASPVVAGVMALGKQANPAMDVRLARHILARTSTVVDAGDVTTTSDGGWKTNAAGFRFNQNYGFGLINADAFVNMVSQYFVTPQTVVNSGTQAVATAIPDNNATGLTRTFTNTTPGLLEEIVVTLNISHTTRGNLSAYLTNPSGTYTSRLFVNSGTDTGDNIVWDFTTNAFWGESAVGTWSLNVRDTAATTTGTWNSFAISFRMGGIVAVPEPATIATVAIAALGGITFWKYRRQRNRKMLESQVPEPSEACL